MLAPLLASLLALSVVSPAAAQTKKKKPPADEEAAPKKKPRPAATPGATKAEDDAEVKPKSVRPKIKTPDPEPEVSPPAKPVTAPNATITPEEILEFRAQPAGVRKLIESSLELARQNLTYTFGSADPASGGMDCSGFIYYGLRQAWPDPGAARFQRAVCLGAQSTWLPRGHQPQAGQFRDG